MRCALALPFLSLLMGTLICGCPSDGDGDDTGETDAPLETLEPAPPGAPEDPADGRLTCLGKAGASGEATALELTGYVRTLGDPTGEQTTPKAKVDVFDDAGQAVGTGFSDPAKKGRLSVSVPVPGGSGWVGHAMVTADGFVDYRFQTSNAVVDTAFSGWAWLTTEAELAERSNNAGVTLEAGKGILYGSVHDCDGFGVANVMLQVGGSQEGIFYVKGFDVTASQGWTTEAGRFVVPNLAPGPVTVKAFARLKAGGPLTLLSSMQAVIVADKITAINLDPAHAAK